MRKHCVKVHEGNMDKAIAQVDIVRARVGMKGLAEI